MMRIPPTPIGYRPSQADEIRRNRIGRIFVGAVCGIIIGFCVLGIGQIGVDKIRPNQTAAHSILFAIFFCLGLLAFGAAVFAGISRRWFYCGILAGTGLVMGPLGYLAWMMPGLHS